MLKKFFLIAIVLAIAVAWLGGVLSFHLSPLSLNINKPQKDFLKRVAAKAKNIIYREATEHNPDGNVLSDQIDDKIKQEIKGRVN